MPTLAGKPELFSAASAALITYLVATSQIDLLQLKVNEIGAVLAGAAGTLLGFLMTAIALMASIMDRDLLKNLRATGGYSVLMRRAFTCASMQLALLIAALCLLYPWDGSLKRMVTIVALFISLLAFSYLFCVGASFYKILIRISKR